MERKSFRLFLAVVGAGLWSMSAFAQQPPRSQPKEQVLYSQQPFGRRAPGNKSATTAVVPMSNAYAGTMTPVAPVYAPPPQVYIPPIPGYAPAPAPGYAPPPPPAYFQPQAQMIPAGGVVQQSSAPVEVPTVVATTVTPESPVESPAAVCQDDQSKSECEDAARFGVFGDFLFLSVRGVDVVYAQQEGVQGGPDGPLGIISPDYDNGFRVGGVFTLSKCAGLEAVFSRFQSHTEDSIIAEQGSFLRALVRGPNSPTISPTSLAASALYEIDFDAVDLNYKHVLACDCDYIFNGLAGVRYGRLNQDFAALFQINGDDLVTSGIRHQGVGPTLGLEGEYLVCGGFTVFGRGAASVLVTNVEASYRDFNEFASELYAIDYTDDRLMPVLELELGLGWTSCCGMIRAKAGYYAAAWCNSVTTPGFVEAIQDTNFSTSNVDLSETITFDGLTARVEFRW